MKGYPCFKELLAFEKHARNHGVQMSFVWKMLPGIEDFYYRNYTNGEPFLCEKKTILDLIKAVEELKLVSKSFVPSQELLSLSLGYQNQLQEILKTAIEGRQFENSEVNEFVKNNGIWLNSLHNDGVFSLNFEAKEFGHGDLHQENILLNASGIQFIDFEEFYKTQGLPDYDLTSVYLNIYRPNRSLFKKFPFMQSESFFIENSIRLTAKLILTVIYNSIHRADSKQNFGAELLKFQSRILELQKNLIHVSKAFK